MFESGLKSRKFDIAEAGLFRGGLNNYKEHNFTSIVEHLAEKRLEAEERYKRHLAEIEEMHRKGLNEIHTSRKSEKHIARWRKLCYIVDMGKP